MSFPPLSNKIEWGLHHQGVDVYLTSVPVVTDKYDLTKSKLYDAFEVTPEEVPVYENILQELRLDYTVSNKYGRKDRRHIILSDNALKTISENLDIIAEALQ